MTTTETNFENTLAKFIAIPTIANDNLANQTGINFITDILIPLGFQVSIEGHSIYHQPVIVAKYTNAKSDKKIVLYGHYDVEKINANEKWDTPPFKLIEKNGRYYGRGIADNKGVLLTRLLTIKEMIEEGHEMPNILFVIQGEEEIEGKTPFEVIPQHFSDFNSKIYIEETGMHREGQPLILFQSNTLIQSLFLNQLNDILYSGAATIENRKLNKFNECAFLTSIPSEGLYIAFGPNDEFCNIHKENESISKQGLIDHKTIFRKFIQWANTTQWD